HAEGSFQLLLAGTAGQPEYLIQRAHRCILGLRQQTANDPTARCALPKRMTKERQYMWEPAPATHTTPRARSSFFTLSSVDRCSCGPIVAACHAKPAAGTTPWQSKLQAHLRSRKEQGSPRGNRGRVSP